MKGKTGDYKITYVNSAPSCSCKGFTYRGRCSHLSVHDVSKLKRLSAKAGKAASALLTDNPQYDTVQEKIDRDEGLKSFMEQTK